MTRLREMMADRCENCGLCKYARSNPEKTFGRLMAWHGKWCPFWKAREEKYGKIKRN
jgi:hypothetical protein